MGFGLHLRVMYNAKYTVMSRTRLRVGFRCMIRVWFSGRFGVWCEVLFTIEFRVWFKFDVLFMVWVMFRDRFNIGSRVRHG
jgi:hypothetical protein